jgi:hypothetical protein
MGNIKTFDWPLERNRIIFGIGKVTLSDCLAAKSLPTFGVAAERFTFSSDRVHAPDMLI